MNVEINLSKNLKQKPVDETKLGFGKIFTDHMFVCKYTTEKGWHNPTIKPYADISLDPSSMCLHYGQTVFEGMKAYRAKDGRILLFRPQENFKRLNSSNERLCIPEMDVDMCVEWVKKFVEIEKDWVPHLENASLYLRPFVIATQANLGVCASSEYLFIIIASPSGPYYASGLNPVKIYVENEYVRAVRGGTGACKMGGNYAASIKSQEDAHKQDYSQVLWLDGVDRKYIEEVGAMNIFFVVDNEILTPMLNGSILSGITRKSVIELLTKKGYKVTERKISIEEISKAYDDGKLQEVFGTGTAAVVSPVGVLKYDDKVMEINNGEIGDISNFIYTNLTGIQWGNLEDEFGWSEKVCD